MEATEGLELTPEQELALEIEKQTKAHKIGANWYYWIAGLSLVNSAIVFFGGQWNFVVGLGITQFFDYLPVAFAEELSQDELLVLKVFVVVLDLFAAAVFALFGWLANRRKGWAFGLGMVLYAIDGLIFILVQDRLSIAFHAFALFGLFGGYAALKKLRELEAQIPGAPIEPIGV